MAADRLYFHAYFARLGGQAMTKRRGRKKLISVDAPRFAKGAKVTENCHPLETLGHGLEPKSVTPVLCAWSKKYHEVYAIGTK